MNQPTGRRRGYVGQIKLCVRAHVCGLVVDHEISTQLFIFLNQQHRNPPQRENLNLSPLTT